VTARGGVRAAALVGVVVLAATACVREVAIDPTGSPSPTPEPRELTVFAAASLTGAFKEIAEDFKLAHDGVDVALSFGPSDGLAAQIQSEGTADVFASASQSWMNAVSVSPGVEFRTDFVRNELVVITPAENPAQIETFEDLAEPGVQLILAAEGVPAGDYAREALDNAGILDAALANVVSNEEDVAAVVAKILGGEADAGIAYVSDVSVAADNDLGAVEIPDDVNVTATYPIAVVEGSKHPDLAQEFIAWLSTAQGVAVLEDYGFDPVD
jgi:molybdate transport system substrate-binding protein